MIADANRKAKQDIVYTCVFLQNMIYRVTHSLRVTNRIIVYHMSHITHFTVTVNNEHKLF